MTSPAGPSQPTGPTGPPRRDLEVFAFPATGQQIRTVLRGDEPWFVAADVCAVLGYSNGRMAVGRLPERMRGVTEVDTLGGRQAVTLISEPGAYRLIMRSNLPAAEAFQDWLAEEVIPAIRHTGHYEVAPVHQIPQSFAEALQLAADQAREIEQQRAELAIAAPKADAWDVLASAHGDYSVREAAFMLNRIPGVDTGQQRLFKLLRDWKLIDRHNRPYAAHARHVRLRARSYKSPNSGDERTAEQVRITVEGLNYLRKRLTEPPFPEVSAS